jgi:hypothetical protein
MTLFPLIPAKAGTHLDAPRTGPWTPAFAGEIGMWC